MVVPRDRFPRGRVRARVVSDTERELGSLPMVVIAPVVAAIVGAAMAVRYTPAERVHHGVVAGPSLWVSLLLAAVGAAAGIFLVLTVLGLSLWLGYLARPERIWSLGHTDGADGRAFTLVSRTTPPAKPIALADLEIWIERSPGDFEVVGGATKLRPGSGSAWVFDQAEMASEPGRARVYSLPPGARAYEVLRTTIRSQ
jgi:hypothetical protein